MNFLNPIYTEKRECQDCYKCVRHCPVKAIRVQEGYASVIPELCIVCGQCVEVCPNTAKRVRDDLPHARQLLASRPRVFVSLAPSYLTEFPDVSPARMIRALKQLGFAGVSETALGAQQVSAQAARSLQDQPSRCFISSACPTVVRFLQKYRPTDAPLLLGLLSPLLTHCRMMRDAFGPDIGIVFIGPCIAKKLEAADHPQLLEVALTFQDLRRWFESAGIDPATVEETAGDRFVPEDAAEGVWYPVDGGMVAGIKSACRVNDRSCMAFSGLPAIERALQGLGDQPGGEGLFLELLACEGGCVNGPRASRRHGTVLKRARILRHGRSSVPFPRHPSVDSRAAYGPTPAAATPVTEMQLREALRSVGKLAHEDELNCGGCGYDSCRQFAGALLERKAERSMCVTFMRKLALKKANALIQKMPSAVVIVNEQLRILECNQAFASRFGSPSSQAPAGLEGSMLTEVLPFAGLFQSVLRSGEDLLERDLRFQNTILHTSIFNIEKHCVAGAILQDITEPAVRKQQVIRKAREVIQKSLATTQEIARLLGENAAESEITLNSIIESFSPPRPEEPKAENDWRKLYRR